MVVYVFGPVLDIMLILDLSRLLIRANNIGKQSNNAITQITQIVLRNSVAALKRNRNRQMMSL